MKRFAAGALLAFVLAIGAGRVSPAQAGTIDGSLIFATEPAGGFDSTVGIGVGGTFDLSKASLDVRTAVRVDMAYFDWDGDVFVNASYERLIFFGGPRFYFGSGRKMPLTPYLEGGLELSFDEVRVGNWHDSDTEIGLAGGGGVEIPLGNRAKLGIGARLHVIDDDFMSIAFSFGYEF